LVVVSSALEVEVEAVVERGVDLVEGRVMVLEKEVGVGC
jgi:hypothetical protein